MANTPNTPNTAPIDWERLQMLNRHIADIRSRGSLVIQTAYGEVEITDATLARHIADLLEDFYSQDQGGQP